MTTRNSGPGGRIPPDGRAPQPPGVGAQARRHDLERPATPGLHGSDLQQGDVQRLEAAQQVQPIGGKKTQTPNPGARQPAQPGGGAGGGFNMQVPDAMQFASQRLKGTLTGPPSGAPSEFDFDTWMPLLRRLVSNPTASGPLASAYIAQLNNLQQRGRVTRGHYVDMNLLDDAVEASL